MIVLTAGGCPNNYYCRLPDTVAGRAEARRLLDVLAGRTPGRTKRLVWRDWGEQGILAFPSGVVLSEDGIEWPCVVAE